MSNCDKIEAHIRMEERYQGLSLVFGEDEALKEEILEAIEVIEKETDQHPFVFEKISTNKKDLQAIYIEFRDDIHREGGEFLTKVLEKLDIDKCAKDI